MTDWNKTEQRKKLRDLVLSMVLMQLFGHIHFAFMYNVYLNMSCTDEQEKYNLTRLQGKKCFLLRRVESRHATVEVNLITLTPSYFKTLQSCDVFFSCQQRYHQLLVLRSEALM